ncbi:MAG: glycosyltransferase family 4 protein [Thermoplasmata archaeon]
METLKVCLLAPDFLPVWGGAGTYAVELSRELSRLVDLTVVTLERGNGAASVTRDQMEEILEHRARVVLISQARDTFQYNAGFQLAVLRRLPRLVKQEKIDIVHSQHAHMPDLLYGRLYRSPITVRTVHSTIATQWDGICLAQRFGGELQESERWQVALEPLLRMTERVVLTQPGAILTVSEWMRNHLLRRKIPKRRIQVVYNGVRVDRFRPDAPGKRSLGGAPNAPVVLFSGRPTLLKGAGVLIEAMPLVWKEFPQTYFAFAGGSPDEVKAHFEGRNVPLDRIGLLGRLAYDELPGVYASADIAVAPTFADNVPFWILEAMASGVPTVASRVGGIPEILKDGETGLLVPPGSARALADALIALLRDPDRRKAIGHAARSRVEERFAWTQAAQETMQSYRTNLQSAG